MKSVCISMPNVCNRTLMDGAKFVDYFKLNGWETTNDFSKADLVLIGLCGVDVEMERASLKYLSIAQQKAKKGARFIVTGCFTGFNKDLILNGLDLKIINPQNIEELDDMINSEVKIKSIHDCNELDNYSKSLKNCFNSLDHARSRYDIKRLPCKCLAKILKYRSGYANPSLTPKVQSFYIKVGRGCLGSCTYCGLKNFFGSLNSKPMNRILKEFHNGLSKGYQMIRLIGEDVGSYGQDIGTNITELLQELFSQPGNYRLAIDDFSPRWLIRYFPELSEIIVQNKHKIDYLGFPIQSGSEPILDLMKREYKAAEAKQCMLYLKSNGAGINLNTHVIVGFPGETETDFMGTLNFLEEVQFNRVTIYKYSDRPTAIASSLPGKVPQRTIMKRIRKLICFLNGLSVFGS